MKKKIVLMLPMCMIVLFAVCQNRVVTGSVTDEKGIPVERASVSIQGTRIRTATDQLGNYRLGNVAPNATLQVSAVNTTPKTVSVGTSGTVNIVIKLNDQETYGVTIGAFGIRRGTGYVPDRTAVDPRSLTNGKPNAYLIPNQSIIVTGVVTDDKGTPLPDVSVRITSTNASTGTDSLGRYRIYAASDTCTLIFETFGAWPMKENIKGRSEINISFQYPEEAFGVEKPLFNRESMIASAALLQKNN